MRDLRVSVAVLSGACRRGASRFCRGVAGSFLLETAATLCSSCQELKLLGDPARLGPWTEPGLCFAVTTTVTLDSGEGFPRKFAVAAQHFAAFVWSLGLSDLHARHRRFGFRCFDPLGGTVVEAAACAFVFQAALMRVWDLKEQVRVPLVAATVTALVYAGGGTSGAVYNPVLAFSIIFPGGGHTHLEYCFIYWLGPLLGMSSCNLLFEKILPFLSGQSHKQKLA